MKKKSDYFGVLKIALLSGMITGCEVIPVAETQSNLPAKENTTKPIVPLIANSTATNNTSTIVSPTISPDVQALKDGLQLYNNGDYNGAIKKLNNASEIWSGSNKSVQLEAIKHLAFSYCVTSKTQLCQQQFERALKLDPSFELAAGEIGHPLWGPVFLKAKHPKKAK